MLVFHSRASLSTTACGTFMGHASTVRIPQDIPSGNTELHLSTRIPVTTKLTLSVPEKFKRTARALSRRRKKSISALVVELIEREAQLDKDPFENLRGIWKDNAVDADEIRARVWKRS